MATTLLIRSALPLGVLIAVLSMLAGLYRGSGLSCAGSTMEGLCAALRGAPGLGMAAIVGGVLYLALDHAARRDLLRRLRKKKSLRRGLVLGALGLLLATAPLWLASEQALRSPTVSLLLALTTGATLMQLGTLRLLMRWGDWRAWLLRAEARPLIALAAALALPPMIAPLVTPLGAGVMADSAYYAALLVLMGLGLPVEYYLETRILGIAPFHVDVIASCSGMEGVSLTLIFAVTLSLLWRADLRQTRFWLLLVPLALLLSWALNVLRIAGIVIIGAYLSPEHAMNGFHLYGGWLALLLTTGTLLVLAQRARKPTPERCLPPEN